MNYFHLLMATYVGIDIAKDHLDISVREAEPPEESSAEPESTRSETSRVETLPKDGIGSSGG